MYIIYNISIMYILYNIGMDPDASFDTDEIENT